MREIAGKLADRAPLAIVAIGVFVFIVGAAGGFPVGNPPLQIADPAWRIMLGVLGILLVTAGILLQLREDKRRDSTGGDPGGSKIDDRPVYQVHKYSGTWIVQNSFSRWRDTPITEPDKVSFNGKTLLLIPIDGEGGVGIQIGRLDVRVKNYHAIYEIVNEVQGASVDKTNDELRMEVKVIRRQLVVEDFPASEDDRYADLRRPLENPNFSIVLERVADTPLLLKGSHDHEDALSKDQKASEKYTYAGLFRPPGL